MLDLNNAPSQHEVTAAPLWAHSRAPSAAASPGDALAAFRAAAQARGVLLPPELITDGDIHRCDAVGHNGDGDAAYLLHLDGLPAGGFQNWQDGIGWQDWHADPGRPLTPAETDELRRKAEADRVKRLAAREASRTDAAARAVAIWDKAEPDPDHPYLARKGIAAHGARREDRTNNLVVSMHDERGAIVNIQRIDPAGEKLFLKGGRKIGCSFTIGKPNGGPVLIAEGFATAASIHRATGLTVVVAFDGGNLLPVGQAIRASVPDSLILICADDDWKTEGNPGQAKAIEAAAQIGARVIVPEFGPDRPDGATDFNDVAALRGEAEVKRQIEAAIGAATDTKPAESEILPSQPEVSSAIETLTKESDPNAIRAVIEKIAAARLGSLWEGPMLSRIKDRTTGQTILALRAALEDVERQFAPPRPQSVAVAIQFSNRAWMNSPDLATDKDGDPKETMANVALAIREDEEWKNSIWFDEFGRRIRVRMRLPWEDGPGAPCDRDWTKEDLLATVEWIQRAGVQARKNVVLDAVERVAFDNKFHPLRDYLDFLKWDVQPRLDRWAIYYLGVEDTPYARAVGACWMIGAVARIYRPGCKMDTAIILEGRQGLGKSSALKVLASEKWFTDQIAALGTKDAAIDTVGKWIVELAELDGVKKADVSQVKAFVSRATDHYRPPYETNSIDVPRQFVFGGSVNEDEYLKDPTGGRRFWPLRCTSIDLDALKHDRDQLWAEAVARFLAGEKWHLVDEELISAAEREQADRYEPDAFESLISDWLDRNTRKNVTVADVLSDALEIRDRAKWTKAEQMRVGACMKRLGWKRKQIWIDQKPQWRYVRPIEGG